MRVDFDEAKIDAVFAELDQSSLPGAAVGIAIDGTPVYRQGFGLASMELPVVLSPTIRMRLGSTTKHFACLTFMLLCEEGKASPDAPIGTYLPELHPVAHQVTPRQVMGHLSGLRNAVNMVWQFSGTGHAVSADELLSMYQHIDDVNAAPGTTWDYNNGGYLLLSVAIERITGQSLETVLQERIFEPVGMQDTLLRRFDTDFVPNSATLHMTDVAGRFEKSYLGTALTGEGGMVSTVDDMLRWMAHMDAPIVGSKSTWDAMRTPQTLANGTSTGYGLGLMVDRYHGVDTLSHPGGVMGGSAQMLKVPGAGLDIVVLVNRRDVSSIALGNRILDACIPGLEPVRKPASCRVIRGTFRSPATGRVVQLLEKDGQQIVSIDAFDVPFERVAERLLLPTAEYGAIKQSVTLIDDAAIRFSDFGNVDELVAVAAPRSTALGLLAGCYRSESTRTDAVVEEDSVLRTFGRFGSAQFRLRCLADGVWRADWCGAMPWGGVLSFEPDGSAFYFSCPWIRALPFQRTPR
jgi:D-aminopeptidase